MSEITLRKLERALQRLLDGVPKRTKNDGKINISRINNEAGLKVSNINYYPEFIKDAQDRIRDHFDAIAEKNIKDAVKQEKSEVEILKDKLKHEQKLKRKYREEKNEQKLLNDDVVKQNVSLAFRVMELESELHSLSSHKVAPIR
ncbi:hypothetical protein [Pseudoalteromonas sp. DL-6]|jgi:hypothetical protein|uniref:hypothetical protein n=1 Tax=Pseudoalteromonas sp. DL-6 TaxID=1390185 RepID=UPI00103E416B|nr:hypothetical protein [Pseudoalteromonas sp. DL-6]QBJ61837.1 hypothetical protein B1F84_01715 [Pseudoalteromonas sp. DL-6]|tara:strand:+ start:1104 stop:1538 length:435 start_codon:yes stop_codon:yes gene_type:complete